MSEAEGAFLCPRTIREMPELDCGFTRPSALRVDPAGRFWLDPESMVGPVRADAHMFIARRSTGYVAHVGGLSLEWAPGLVPTSFVPASVVSE